MKFAVEGSVIFFSSVCAENLVQKFEELRPLRRRNINGHSGTTVYTVNMGQTNTQNLTPESRLQKFLALYRKSAMPITMVAPAFCTCMLSWLRLVHAVLYNAEQVWLSQNNSEPAQT